MKEQETNTDSSEELKGKPLRNRTGKPVIGAVVGLALVLLVFFGFGYLTNYLAGQLVKNQIEKYTKGVYTAEFEKVKINWSVNRIDLSNFSYKKIDPLTEVDTEIAYSSELAQIKLETILGIYFENALHIEEFVLESPKVYVNQIVKKEKNENFSFKTGNFYKLIQGFIKSFKIDNFEVNHLSFEYEQSYGDKPQHYYVSDLSFNIQDFKLDSAATVEDKKFFFTESVELSIHDQLIDLGDGLHRIHFDSLNLSTANNNIEVYGFTLDTNLNATAKTRDKVSNRYDLKVPYTGIIGLNFLKAYQDNVLEVDRILFDDVNLDASLGSISKQENGDIKLDSSVDNGAIKLLLAVFSEYKLRQFEINRTQLELSLDNGKDTVFVHDLDFEFTGYVLDSTSLSSDTYYPIFEGLKLQIGKPLFKLPNGDQLYANQLNFSTYDSLLVISDVALKTKKRKGKVGNNIKIEAIELHGIKPQEILKENKISLTKLNILKPNIKLVESDNRNKNMRIDFESLLSGKIKNVDVAVVKVIDGLISFNGTDGGIQKTQIRLDGFVLNERSVKKNKFLLSQRARFTLDQVNATLAPMQHQVKANRITVDTKGGRVSLTNWEFNPVISDSATLKFIANAKGKELSVNSIDFNRLSDYKNINLNDLTVKGVSAQINILSPDSVSKSLKSKNIKFLQDLNHLLVNQVVVEDVDLVIQKNGASLAKLSNGFIYSDKIEADSASMVDGKLLFVSDSLEFGLDRLMVPLKKMNHTLNVQKVRQSKMSNFSASGISLRPFPGVKIPDSMASITAYLPALTIDSFDVFGKASIETLQMGQVRVSKPSVKIRLPHHDTNAASSSFKLPESLPLDFVDSIFQGFNIQGVTVEDAKLKIKKDTLDIAINSVNLNSSGIEISKSSSWNPNKFLYANDFNLVLSSIEYKVPGLKSCHHVDSVRYQFNPNALEVFGVYFNNTSDKEVKTGMELSFYLPNITFSRPNVYEYLTDSVLTIDKIYTGNGLLEADVYGNKKNSKPFKIPSAVPDFKGLAGIAVHEIDLSRMDVQMTTYKNGLTAPLEMDHFNLHVDSFHVYPGEEIDSNRLFWSDDITLSVQNVYSTVDEGLYEIGADKFAFSTQNDSIGLSGLSFVPTVPRLEYPFHKGGYQKDVFNINLKQLNIKDFDFFHLIYQGKIKGGEIDLDKPQLAVFKDKRNNVPEFQYKDIIPQMFKVAPIKISFDSVMVNQMNIRYDEFPKTGREPGYLMLTHTDIKVLNLTNDSSELKIDSTLEIQMNSKFLDAADLGLNLSYNMLSPDNRFSMSTTLGSMDATLINTYIGPAYSAELLSADVDRMYMSVIGTDSITGGKMGLFYDNLKFQFIDKQGHQSKRFITWIGNRVVDSRNKYNYFKKPKDIFYVRDTSKGWINYLVKIELHGVQANAGINKNQGKEAKKAEKEVWKNFEKEYKLEQKALGEAEKRKDKAQKKLQKKLDKKKKKSNSDS